MASRIDVILVERGLARSRSQAQALIKSGSVVVDGVVIAKTSLSVDYNANIHIIDSDINQYVSRGGIKLVGALAHVGLNPSGLTVLDMGQSTGGFTDCLLQQGVVKVVGVDVGRDQLAASLRADERVVCYEGVNGRDLPTEALLSHSPGAKGFDLAVMDVSFISQTLIIPSLLSLLKPGGFLLSLVKPQFELQPMQIGKNGLVKSPDSYPIVEKKLRDFLASLGISVVEYFDSPIEGGDGNREFFVLAQNKF